MKYSYVEVSPDHKHAHNYRDIVGKKFEKCEVLRLVGHDCYDGVKKKPVYECLCFCGSKFLARGNDLKTKRQKTCGKHSEFTAEYNKKTKTKVFWDTKANVYASYRKGAKDRGIDFNIPKHKFYEIIKRDCFYCGEPASNIRKPRVATKTSSFIYSGIDRLDSNGPYTLENCIPCCSVCNRMKVDSSLVDWIEKIEKIYKRSRNVREFRDLLNALKYL